MGGRQPPGVRRPAEERPAGAPVLGLEVAVAPLQPERAEHQARLHVGALGEPLVHVAVLVEHQRAGGRHRARLDEVAQPVPEELSACPGAAAAPLHAGRHVVGVLGAQVGVPVHRVAGAVVRELEVELLEVRGAEALAGAGPDRHRVGRAPAQRQARGELRAPLLVPGEAGARHHAPPVAGDLHLRERLGGAQRAAPALEAPVAGAQPLLPHFHASIHAVAADGRAVQQLRLGQALALPVAGAGDRARRLRAARQVVELRVVQRRREAVPAAGQQARRHPPAELRVVGEVVHGAGLPPLPLAQHQRARLHGQRRVAAPAHGGGAVHPVGQGAGLAGAAGRAVHQAPAHVGRGVQPAPRERQPDVPVGAPLGPAEQRRRRPPALGGGAAGDDVDHPAHRLRPVERALRPLHHLHPLDHRRRDARHVEVAGDAADERLPVEQHEHALRADPLEHHAGAGRVAALELHAGLLGEHRGEVGGAGLLDLVAPHHLGGDGDVGQPLRAAGRGDDDLVEGERRRRQPHDERRVAPGGRQLEPPRRVAERPDGDRPAPGGHPGHARHAVGRGAPAPLGAVGREEPQLGAAHRRAARRVEHAELDAGGRRLRTAGGGEEQEERGAGGQRGGRPAARLEVSAGAGHGRLSRRSARSAP